MYYKKSDKYTLFFLPLQLQLSMFQQFHPSNYKVLHKKNKTALKNKETVLNSLSATQKRRGKLIMKKIFIYWCFV